MNSPEHGNPPKTSNRVAESAVSRWKLFKVKGRQLSRTTELLKKLTAFFSPAILQCDQTTLAGKQSL